MNKIVKLDCGLRLALEKIPHVQSVTAGIWVRAGSVDENDSCRGISHFIEHMMFKGTNKRTAREIASDVDALGGQINAFTSKESTCYYVRTLSSNLEKGLEILVDMLTDSLFDPVEMAKEKQVVKEEIKMMEDNPDDLCQEMLYEVLFKGNVLSNSILGTPESLDAITREDIKRYIRNEYTLDNIVVSVAGNFDEQRVCDFFENTLSAFTAVKEAKPDNGSVYVPNFKNRIKDIEQSHICIGTRALKFADNDAYVMSILNNIMGGSMSSRLFQNIREEKGLAYSVYSYTSSHDRTGFYAISAGVAHEKIEDTVAAIREELDNLAAHGVSDRELEISKEQTKGGLIFSMENTSNRMVSNGRFALMRNRLRNIEDVIKAIDSITQDDIRRVTKLITDVSSYSGALVSRRDVDLAQLMK